MATRRLLALGDDPVLGRQAWPGSNSSQPSVKEVEELLLGAPSRRMLARVRSTWRLGAAHRLFWRSGAAGDEQGPWRVRRGGAAQGQSARAPALVGAGVPALRPDGDLGVIVRFKAAPPYGPFVLNGAPFYRKTAAPAGGLAFECAGLYQIRKMAFGVALAPAQGYQAKRSLPEIRLDKDGATPPPGGKRLELRYAYQVLELF